MRVGGWQGAVHHAEEDGGGALRCARPDVDALESHRRLWIESEDVAIDKLDSRVAEVGQLDAGVIEELGAAFDGKVDGRRAGDACGE